MFMIYRLVIIGATLEKSQLQFQSLCIYHHPHHNQVVGMSCILGEDRTVDFYPPAFSPEGHIYEYS